MAMDLQVIERFNGYPQRPDYVFHCGIVRLPFWVEDATEPFRPHLGLCACPEVTALNASELMGPEQNTFEGLLDAIAGAGRITTIEKVRPGRIIVTDPEIAQYLRQALRDSEVEITVMEDDPLLQQFAQGLASNQMLPNAPPGPLDGKGMTLERMQSFADAARRFWGAAPWKHLTDEDLIRIESPKPPKELGFVTVLGAGGHSFGLGFFKSKKQFEDLTDSLEPMEFMETQGRVWSLNFGRIDDLPVPDAELFEEQGLAIAADDAYPCFIGNEIRKKRLVRPDAAALSFVEGLLRALAQSSEEQMDTGRWKQRVGTADGEVEYTLSLPGLSDPVPTRDEWNQPLDLADQANEARGRKQLQLARKAIERDPEDSEAYLVLAMRESDHDRAIGWYSKAVELAARKLGEKFFQENTGHFWGMLATRPYMRARKALADRMRIAGRLTEAAEHYSVLLVLNPGDNQGSRYLYWTVLYQLGRFDEAQRSLDDYRDGSAEGYYLRALLAFRSEGDSASARRLAAIAIKENKFARKFLTGELEMPIDIPPAYTLGSEEEGMIIAYNQLVCWQSTPDAPEWLVRQKSARSASPKKRPGKPGKRK
jgi:hypothetical protein